MSSILTGVSAGFEDTSEVGSCTGVACGPCGKNSGARAGVLEEEARASCAFSWSAKNSCRSLIND